MDEDSDDNMEQLFDSGDHEMHPITTKLIESITDQSPLNCTSCSCSGSCSGSGDLHTTATNESTNDDVNKSASHDHSATSCNDVYKNDLI